MNVNRLDNSRLDYFSEFEADFHCPNVLTLHLAKSPIGAIAHPTNSAIHSSLSHIIHAMTRLRVDLVETLIIPDDLVRLLGNQFAANFAQVLHATSTILSIILYTYFNLPI